MITKLDIENCITACRPQSSEVPVSKRLEARRQKVRELHAKGVDVPTIIYLVYGIDVVNDKPEKDLSTFNRAIDLSDLWANKVAALEREVQSVINESPLANAMATTRPAPQDVGRPRKNNGQFEGKAK